jgi:hypothetical protein
MKALGHPDRLAPHVYRRVRGRFYKSFKDDLQFNSERNRRECLAWANCIDGMLRAGLGKRSDPVEIAVRRLTGVHAADFSGGDWSLCDELEVDGLSQSILPAKVLKRMMANTARLKAVRGEDKERRKGNSNNYKPRATGNSSSSSSSNPSNYAHKPKNDKSGAGPAGKGGSAQP